MAKPIIRKPTGSPVASTPSASTKQAEAAPAPPLKIRNARASSGDFDSSDIMVGAALLIVIPTFTCILLAFVGLPISGYDAKYEELPVDADRRNELLKVPAPFTRDEFSIQLAKIDNLLEKKYIDYMDRARGDQALPLIKHNWIKCAKACIDRAETLVTGLEKSVKESAGGSEGSMTQNLVRRRAIITASRAELEKEKVIVER
ncbi:MAG: hypothetical protein ACKVX7_04630 [Planctomycetota bacterium]